MSFWEGEKRKKLDRWSFDKSLVAPEWGVFHKYLIGAWMPFRQSTAGDGTTVFDISRSRNHGTIDNSSGDVTLDVGSLSFSGDATNDRIDLGSIVDPHPLNLRQISEKSRVPFLLILQPARLSLHFHRI